jgi:hypothetical protein
MTGIPGTCHYLEASPANLTGGTGSEATMKWSTGITFSGTVVTSNIFGRGKNNTEIIVAAESAAYPGNSYIYAARACSEYRGGGKDDWFLPNLRELEPLFEARGKTGVPATGLFWTSDLVGSTAFYKEFGMGVGMGEAGTKNRWETLNVRAVRAF